MQKAPQVSTKARRLLSKQANLHQPSTATIMSMMCKRYYNFECCVLLRSSPIFETLPHQMPEFAIKSPQPKRYKQPTKSVEPFFESSNFKSKDCG